MTTSKLPIPRSVSALAWIPGIALALAASWLLANWSRVPASWPVHYGPTGEPDGWTHKSIGAGFAPIFIGAFIWILLEFATAASLQQKHDASVVPVTVAGVRLGRLVTAAIAVLCASLAVSMPFVADLGLWFVVPFVGVFVAAGVGIHGIHRALKQTRKEHPEVHAGYNAIYYFNRDDDRLWVPKISGLGYTINFAHKRAWLTMAVLLVVPLTAGAIGLVSAILAAR